MDLGFVRDQVIHAIMDDPVADAVKIHGIGSGHWIAARFGRRLGGCLGCPVNQLGAKRPKIGAAGICGVVSASRGTGGADENTREARSPARSTKTRWLPRR